MYNSCKDLCGTYKLLCNRSFQWIHCLESHDVMFNIVEGYY